VITLIAQKGGAGKTTLSINLAVAAEAAGRRAVLVDIDPQASAAAWGDHRQSDRPVIAAVPPSRLAAALAAGRAHAADLAVLDTPPHSESSALAAVRASDLALIPLRPGILDLRALRATADICALAATAATVVLNQVPARGRLADQAAEAVRELGLAVAPVRIGQRAALTHALTAGLGVTEYAPASRASAEIRDLHAWVHAQLAERNHHVATSPI